MDHGKLEMGYINISSQGKRRNCTSDLRLWSLAGSWMIHWWFPVKAARPIVLTNMNTADIHQYNSNFSNNAISTKSIASCKCHPCLPFANDMNLRCHNLPNKRAHATAWFAPSVRSLRSSGARCVATEAVLPDQMPAHHREAHDEASITQDHKSISRIHALAHPNY